MSVINKILSFLSPPTPEYLDSKYNSLTALSLDQIHYILDVIDDEVKISAKFGLKIKPEHLAKEKIVIMTIFNKYGQGISKNGRGYTDQEYTQMHRYLLYLADELLSKEIEYYFYNTPKNKVKNKYNCHLNSLVSRLFRDFVNHECHFFVKYKPLE